MNAPTYLSKPIFYGIVYAAAYGIGVLVLSFPAIYLLIRPDVEFWFAWKAVFDVTASGVVGSNVLGFLHGWARARNRPQRQTG